MDFKNFILNEMRVHRFGDDPNRLFAFRDNIWLFDRDHEDDDELAQQIWDNVRAAFDLDKLPKTIRDEFENEEVTMEDIERFFQDYLQDGISGYWDGDRKNLNISMGGNPSPVSSPLFKKVAQSLGAIDISYDNEEVYYAPYGGQSGGNYDYDHNSYTYDSQRQMIGNVPGTMYHGTTSLYLPNIAKYGLMPGESPSNFAKNDVYHTDKIFLADRQSEARHFAGNATREQEGFGMVVMVKIPDPSKLLPDYDVDRHAMRTDRGKNTYPDQAHYGDNEWEVASVSPWRATKQAGKYAYQGRIPASHILGIEVRFNSQDGWEEIDITYAQELINRFGNEWTEYYGYDLDELDGFEEDEDY